MKTERKLMGKDIVGVMSNGEIPAITKDIINITSAGNLPPSFDKDLVGIGSNGKIKSNFLENTSRHYPNY